MSKIKHPKAKKVASLKRDHRVYPWEGDKSFRGVWRKKKRRMAKRARADSREALRRVGSGDDEKASRAVKQPRQLRKTGVVSLEKDVHVKQHDARMRFSEFRYSSSEFTR